MTCQLSDARPEFAKSLTPQSACCSMTLGLTPLSRQFIRGDTLRSLLNDQLQSQPTNTLLGYLSVLEQLTPLFPQHHLKCSPTSWSAALSLPSSTPSPPTFKSAKPSTVPIYVTEMTDTQSRGTIQPGDPSKWPTAKPAHPIPSPAQWGRIIPSPLASLSPRVDGWICTHPLEFV